MSLWQPSPNALSRPAAKPVEVLDVVALLLAGLVGDPTALHELRQVLVHRVHAVLRTCLQRAVDLVRLALTDEVAHGRRGHEDLGRHCAAATVSGLGQGLADDALKGAGELDTDLLLLVRRGNRDDTGDRLRPLPRAPSGGDPVGRAHSGGR